MSQTHLTVNIYKYNKYFAKEPSPVCVKNTYKCFHNLVVCKGMHIKCITDFGVPTQFLGTTGLQMNGGLCRVCYKQPSLSSLSVCVCAAAFTWKGGSCVCVYVCVYARACLYRSHRTLVPRLWARLYIVSPAWNQTDPIHALYVLLPQFSELIWVIFTSYVTSSQQDPDWLRVTHWGMNEATGQGSGAIQADLIKKMTQIRGIMKWKYFFLLVFPLSCCS